MMKPTKSFHHYKLKKISRKERKIQQDFSTILKLTASCVVKYKKYKGGSNE